MRVKITFMLALTVLASACDSATDIDVRGLEPIPALEQLDFSRVRPAQDVDYWELRFAFRSCFDCNDPPDEVIGAGGRLTRAQLDTGTLRVLDALRPHSGFAPSCLPGLCFFYVVAMRDGITVHATVTALRQFLGAIETSEEAILLLRANGYRWNPNERTTGMEASGSSWTFVALQMVQFCAPVQTDRVLLAIEADGLLRELKREVWQRDRNSCV